MASDTKTLNSLATHFKTLLADDQIAVLGNLYQTLGGALPAIEASDKVDDLLNMIGDMRDGSQIEFMQDVMNDRNTKVDEVSLDPNPSKALLELIPGDNVEPPLTQYHKLSATERLAFWAKLASNLGDEVIAMPSDYALSPEATEVLNSLKSLGTDETVSFLGQVV